MNIVVKTSSGHFLVRPDTTWERDNENLFLPEYVTRISFTPILYARICKSGRSVSEKFASRYYDDTGYGILLYPENFIDGSPEGFAQASCLDHSSFFTLPGLGEDTFKEGFSLEINDRQVFHYSDADRKLIENAISEATSMIYFRTGDVIAVELSERQLIPERTDCSIKGQSSDRTIIDFKLIL